MSLFGGEDDPARVPAPTHDAALVELGRRLPAAIAFGTSSWSFPGWEGLVWSGAHTQQRLSRHGLPAYVRHPLFRTVGLDRSYYGPVDDDTLTEWSTQLPAGFPVVVKAWEHITLPSFPSHPRYGRLAGQANPSFLSPRVFMEEVVAPLQRAFANHVDAVLLEFSPMSTHAHGGVDAFVARLDDFLGQVIGPFRLVVELRNAELMTSSYARLLDRHGVHHAYNRWTHTPPIRAQLSAVGAPRGDRAYVRLLLPAGRTYEERLRQCEPFSSLVDVDRQAREDVEQLAIDALVNGRQVRCVVNNKAEGSAPLTIRALAEGVVRRLG